jgi:hypothetical protein
MVKEQVRVSDFHFDHKLWMNELKFFEMQLEVFEGRLEEVVLRISDRTALAAVEAFQNQIIRQREVIDQLKHKFRVREKDLDALSNDLTIDSDHVLFADHRREREEMQIFIKLYQEMREKYMHFLEVHA